MIPKECKRLAEVDFPNWDLAANSTYLDASQALVKAAYPEETPLVVDPFDGRPA